MKNTKLHIALDCVTIGLSILFLVLYLQIMSSLVMYINGVWIFDEGAVYVTALMIAAEILLIILVLLLIYIIPKLSKMRKALKKLGNDPFGKCLRDKVARMAFRAVYAVMDGRYIYAEKLFYEITDLSHDVNNQIFCYEWLTKIYAESEEEELYRDKFMMCIRKNAELAPDNLLFQIRLANVYMTERSYDKALYYYEKALSIDSRTGFCYYMMAKIYAIRGDDEKAAELLEKALEINENHPDALAELGIIQAMNGNYEQSDENIQKAVLAGYIDKDRLMKEIDAIKRYNNGETYNGNNLPRDYYRRKDSGEE